MKETIYVVAGILHQLKGFWICINSCCKDALVLNLARGYKILGQTPGFCVNRNRGDSSYKKVYEKQLNFSHALFSLKHSIQKCYLTKNADPKDKQRVKQKCLTQFRRLPTASSFVF